MDTKDFLNSLNDIRELMVQEKYAEALVLINELKEIEKTKNLDYNLTHQLYQLDSNCYSLYNQQKIFRYLQEIAKDQETITFHELYQMVKAHDELDISEDILRREIEILVLRSVVPYIINGENIIFKP